MAQPTAPICCPRCRNLDGDVLSLFTLEPISPHRVQCQNDACMATYVIVQGIWLVGDELGDWLQSDALGLAAELPIEVAIRLALDGPDDQPINRLLDHLSIYLEAHYGDHATPGLQHDDERFGFEAIAEKIAARQSERVETAIELGCSVGRGLFELARGADRVIGIDRHAGALRAAAQLCSMGTHTYARRRMGRIYDAATITIERPLAPVHLLATDATNPPLPPGCAGRVAAFNLIDAVANPTDLLAAMDGLCAPGGELLLASPYAWSSLHVDDRHRIGSTQPEREVMRRLRDGDDLTAQYDIEDEADLPWRLRRDDRWAHVYRVHYLRARKTMRQGSRA